MVCLFSSDFPLEGGPSLAWPSSHSALPGPAAVFGKRIDASKARPGPAGRSGLSSATGHRSPAHICPRGTDRHVNASQPRSLLPFDAPASPLPGETYYLSFPHRYAAT